MAAVIDLTIGDDSDGANKNPTTSKYASNRAKAAPRKARVPFQPISNNSQSSHSPRAELAPSLIQAIDSAKIERLRDILKKVCQENASSRIMVEEDFLVESEKVVPYHPDTDSENDEDSLISSSESSEDDDSEESDSDGDEESNERIIEGVAKNLFKQQTEQNIGLPQRQKARKTMREFRSEARAFMEKQKLKKMLKGQKRKAEVLSDPLCPRFLICENCKEEFDVTDNIRGDCIWHEGNCLNPF
jgi:hypothetical protein